MQRIAGMTVAANGSGEFEAIYNGQRDRVVEGVKAEMRRQKEAMCAAMDSMQEAHAAEMEIERDRAEINARGRYRLLGEKLNAMHEYLFARRGPVRRALNAIANAWGMIWAITAGRCWVEMGETLGLWKYAHDDAEH